MDLHSAEGGHLGAVDIERGVAERRVASLDGAGVGERETKRMQSRPNGFRCRQCLVVLAHEVVAELKPAVLSRYMT